MSIANMDVQPMSFDPATLETGDVLLVRSAGALSDLIAWLSNSNYSHAAFVVNKYQLIEALAGKGVSAVPLDVRLATPTISRIDVWRNDRIKTQDDKDLVLAKAISMIGCGYAMDQLVFLGLLMMVEDRPTEHPVLRWVAATALRHLIDQPHDGVVCSELVYRCFAECDAQPAGRLAPHIELPRPVNNTPFPADFDWKGLLAEIEHLFGPKLRSASPSAMQATHDPVAMATAEAPGQAELDQLRLIARAKLAPPLMAAGASMTQMMTATSTVQPNLVAPQDFAASPDMHFKGNLLTRKVAPQAETV